MLHESSIVQDPHGVRGHAARLQRHALALNAVVATPRHRPESTPNGAYSFSNAGRADALVAGLLVGVSEAVAGFVILPSLKSMFSFALLIIVLLVRPQGLFGRRA